MGELKASSLFNAFPFPSPCDIFSPVDGGIFVSFLGILFFSGVAQIEAFFPFLLWTIMIIHGLFDLLGGNPKFLHPIPSAFNIYYFNLVPDHLHLMSSLGSWKSLTCLPGKMEKLPSQEGKH